MTPNIEVCELCGAWVQSGEAGKHEEWHQRLVESLKSVSRRVTKASRR